MPHSPYVIVGCQADRRTRSNDTVSFAEGKSFAESNGASLYAETSALDGSGVQELAQKLVEMVLAERWQNLDEADGKDKECSVM